MACRSKQEELLTMATTIWKGHLSFGLVSIPVQLCRAARAEKMAFRQVHEASGSGFVKHSIASLRHRWIWKLRTRNGKSGRDPRHGTPML